MRKNFVRHCILLILGTVLAACSLATFERHEPLIKLSTQAATARMLQQHPEWTDDTLRITGKTLAYIDGTNQVTVGALADFAKNQIPWKELTPEEQVLLINLLNIVQAEITQGLVLQDVKDPHEVKVVSAKVIGWIRDIAQIRKG